MPGAGGFAAVAVWSLDRFGRGLRQIVTNVYELAELGVEFACVKQAIDLSTMQGRMILYVFAMLAEIEREIIGDRVKSGLRAAKARGKTLGRPLSVDPVAVAELLAKGCSIAQSARRPEGCRSPAGPYPS
jgi:DNA invertase Pin-like site-specific DNA recombinase